MEFTAAANSIEEEHRVYYYAFESDKCVDYTRKGVVGQEFFERAESTLLPRLLLCLRAMTFILRRFAGLVGPDVQLCWAILWRLEKCWRGFGPLVDYMYDLVWVQSYKHVSEVWQEARLRICGWFCFRRVLFCCAKCSNETFIEVGVLRQ
jgi:hypothetical protein